MQQIQIALVGGFGQTRGHIGEAYGCLGVDALDRRRRVHERGRRDAFDMAQRKRAVAVTCEDDLALLGHLESAVHRPLRLREHRAVRRPAPAAHRAAATVHEHDVDAALLGPAGDALLRGMQGERGGDGAGVLRRVRVAQHDLHAPPRLRQAALHGRQLQHPVQHGDAVLQVLQLLEQGNHVQLGHVLRVRECELCQLVDVGHVPSALGERHDVASGHLLPVALLDGADGAERVQHLARHGVELAQHAMGADIG